MEKKEKDKKTPVPYVTGYTALRYKVDNVVSMTEHCYSVYDGIKYIIVFRNVPPEVKDIQETLLKENGLWESYKEDVHNYFTQSQKYNGALLVLSDDDVEELKKKLLLELEARELVHDVAEADDKGLIPHESDIDTLKEWENIAEENQKLIDKMKDESACNRENVKLSLNESERRHYDELVNRDREENKKLIDELNHSQNAWRKRESIYKETIGEAPSGVNSKVYSFAAIAKEISRLYEKKNADYGDSFGETYNKLGIISAVTRMTDKMNRVTKLATSGEQNVKDESLIDTLKDLAAYAIMTIIELQNTK